MDTSSASSEESVADLPRPWYRRGWGIAVLAYLAVTAAIGVWFLVASRGVNFTLADAARARGNTALPSDVPLYDATHPAIGAEDAALVIVEFGGFQCPFSKQAFPVIREIATTYGTTVRHVYRDFPIEELHPDGRRAAEAGRCAHEQGKFWPFHDRLFQNQQAFDAASLVAHAQAVGADRVQFEECLSSGRYTAAVQADMDAGLKLGVRGTPTWFLIPRGNASRAQRVEGVIPRETLLEILKEL